MRFSALLFLMLNFFVSSCKDEAPKQEQPKTQDATTQQTSPDPFYPPVQETPETEEEEATETNDCSNSTEPEITSTLSGGSAYNINFPVNSSITVSFSADDREDCEFAVFKIEESNLPTGITVSGNDSSNLRLTGTIQQTTTSMRTGNFKVYARNISACAKKYSLSECREFDGSSMYDDYEKYQNFSWTIGGTNQGITTGNNNSNTLMMGLGIFASLLTGGNPLSAILSGMSGGNTLTGGGLNNQLISGNQLGINSPLTGTISCNQLSQTQCQQYQQCMLQGISCVQRTSTTSNCTNIFDELQCRNSGCLWNINQCQNTSSNCTNYFDENQCRNAGCTWNYNRCAQL